MGAERQKGFMARASIIMKPSWLTKDYAESGGQLNRFPFLSQIAVGIVYNRLFFFVLKANLDLGTDKFSFGFGGTGKKSHNRNFDDYGEAFGKSDVIGSCLDLDQFEIFFLKNGKHLGRAFSILPQLRNEVFYPAVVLKNAEIQFNFGDEQFKHEPPKGFLPISKTSPDNVKLNSTGATAGVKPPKLVFNAPQAIIIEVSCLFYCS